MTLTSVNEKLERLAKIPAGKHPIVSCYLKLEPRDRTRGKYLIKLKNRMRKVLESLPGLGFGARAEQDAVAEDLDRIYTALDGPGTLPKTQGIALFASKGLRLFEKIEIPTVYRSRLVVDRTPLVRELLAVEDEVGRLLTVVTDRKSARIFEVTAFGAEEVIDIHAVATRGGKFHSDRHGAPGMGEHTYHNRIRTEKERHLSTIADALFELDRKQAVHGIVFAGIGTDASTIERFLHPYLRGRVIGTIKLNPKLSTAGDVHRATLEARAVHEQRSEEAMVRELRDGLGTRWAVSGVGDTLRALAKGQVRTLLVNPDAEVPGFRCDSSGRLVASERECRGDGAPVPVADVIDEAIEEALRQRVAIEVVHSPAAASAVDGLAGLFRFR